MGLIFSLIKEALMVGVRISVSSFVQHVIAHIKERTAPSGNRNGSDTNYTDN
jgi:hypothetical protein